ncbi:hypothetical protein CONPUDRAFT_140517 [Coniophora puteana RWD-64-598 SS2]|uniref:Uncharacterized protein n=1 Tax=Coniophora puteana (strain RWD-64-598) TaxID=741705 RepID=R7SDZ7_CONPW|nr:uncharacterized protein CONPUDRAFT_140517 [Coniophora puteana RWD-64-598 SS2]EIW74396.1 hypothetical protein CONPUDRAFT_140517 [Coniophora puteana RWD-64-598 SS2]
MATLLLGQLLGILNDLRTLPAAKRKVCERLSGYGNDHHVYVTQVIDFDVDRA